MGWRYVLFCKDLNVFQRNHIFPGLVVHDLAQRSQLMRIEAAHKGKITGVCFADEHRLLSCGVDRNIKLWDTRQEDEDGAGPSQVVHKCLVC